MDTAASETTHTSGRGSAASAGSLALTTPAVSGDAVAQRRHDRDSNRLTRNVLLFQLDGKIPNIALMRIAAHHRAMGDDVELRWTGNPERSLWDQPKAVYGSAIFEKTRPAVEKLKEEFPEAVVGGTGVDVHSSLEAHGITTTDQDYSLYPKWQQSIGFTQRGCRLACSFCVVPRKEGAWREEKSIAEIWRGEPWARELILLDNDFFGHPKGDKDNDHWRKCIAEIREGGFKVSFNQGINARFLTDEAAEAIASIDYRDDSMQKKRIYTAWDNKPDEQRLFAGLNRLVKYGVPRSAIMVYILIGYWPGETEEDMVYRAKRLRDFGAMPYPMPFVRNATTVGFQRWVITHYIDKVAWADWKAANFHEYNIDWDRITPAVGDSTATVPASDRVSTTPSTPALRPENIGRSATA